MSDLLNVADHPVPEDTLPGMVERSARFAPDAPALEFEGAVLDYRGLDDWADRVARALAARGTGPGDVVAVAVPRSFALVAGLLGVLKAGAAYLPLDPDLPAEQTDHVMRDARPALVLREPEILRARTSLGADPGAPARSRPPRPDDLAYVIYTSGTTGRPKGVAVAHRAIVNRLCWMQSEYRLRADDRVLLKSPLTFDPSVCEIFWPLAQGATVVLAAPRMHRDPAYLARLIRDRRVTTVHFVASMIPLFLDEFAVGADRDPGPLRRVFSGGEALPANVVDAFCRALAVPLYNQYGPTEAAVDVTYWRARPGAGGRSAPIGRPVWNTRIRLLDSALRPVPDGEPGELHIAGVQLARGYLNRPAETAARFVADPHGAPGDRMYRTGDLARRREDGELEFLGRVDTQIKIRGHRVEPSAAEAVLARHPDVAQAAVTARENRAGEPYLAGYVTAAPGRAPDPQRLRAHCRGALPRHLVPLAFTVLDALPLTANGKLDRRALPAPVESRTAGRAPADDAERLLCAVYAEVLGLPEVGADDDFFDLGGHSLAAARLVGLLRSRGKADLEVRAVFEAPSPAALALRLPPAGPPRGPAPAVAERHGRLPLSPQQRRLRFLHQVESADPSYNVPVAVRLRGPLAPAALEAALADLVDRHEPLRTVFPEHDGEFHQVIRPPGHGPALVTTAVGEGELDALCRAAVRRPFDLAAQPPLRVRLFELGPDHHLLLLVIHHIATDGWSRAPLLRDLAAAYTARCSGQAPAFDPLPARYRDFVPWQDSMLGDPGQPDSRYSSQLRYWRQALADLPEEIALPADLPRPVEDDRRGAAVEVAIEPAVHAALAGLARECRASVFMVLQAGLSALYHRLGAGDDIPLGCVVAGRAAPEFDDVVGMFANTLVLRTDVSGDPTFRQLVGRARERALAAFAAQDLPFDRLVQELNPARSLGRHPLFQTVLLAAVPGAAVDFGPVRAETVPVDSGSARFDLSFELAEESGGGSPDGIRGLLRYAAGRHSPAGARALADRFVSLLTQVAERPDRPVGTLDILLPGERERATVRPVPEADRPRGAHSITVTEAFARRVRAAPDAEALYFEQESYTYAQLDRWSNRIARLLSDTGVRRGDVVGLHTARNPRMVACLLAVLKSGAAYTVLDPDFPVARLGALIRLVDTRLVLSDDTGVLGGVAPAGTVVLDLDERAAAIASQPAEPPGGPVTADDVASVVFTSGSSGEPKGVFSPHRALVVSMTGQDTSPFGPGEVHLQCAPVSWDVFARQLFGPLMSGGACVLQPGQRPEPERIAALVARHRVTVLDCAASLFNFLCDEYPAIFETVRWAVTGGEAASAAHLAALRLRRPDLHLVNGYGPAESMGQSTIFHADLGWSTPGVPIGVALRGKYALVLDARLRPVPPGVPGELYLAGDGLAYGYTGRAALTAERFVADPYGPPGTRLYRTGDLARMTADGILEYLGRQDEQVKIRGFRVEPAEIRAVLAEYPDVRQAEVVTRDDASGARILVAYLVPVAGRSLPDTQRLREYTAARLPEHLVPSGFVVLDRLPRTANGKLDRGALPAPERRVSAAGRAPSSPAESRLCSLYAGLLGVQQVSVDDDFFELGGHSLLVLRLINRIRNEFGVELAVRAVFEARTVAALAAMTARADHARPSLRVWVEANQ